MTFKFTWRDGSTETLELSDCQTVEDAINARCGSNSEWLANCEIVQRG